MQKQLNLDTGRIATHCDIMHPLLPRNDHSTVFARSANVQPQLTYGSLGPWVGVSNSIAIRAATINRLMK